jgi:S1-C subfamily serine protease
LLLSAAAGTALLAGCSTPPQPDDAAIPVAVTAAPVMAATAPSKDNQILMAARQFVFRARNEACLLTGTAFAVDGTIITNRHVAAGADQMDLATWDGDDFEASATLHSDSDDLARMDALAPDDTEASLATSDPTSGTKVWVAGYPEGDQLTVTGGRVLGSIPGAQFGLAGQILEISDHIEHGNSGSPLLESDGDVVGVVFAVDLASGDGLAMPASTLQSFLNESGDNLSLPCAM